jgi:ribosomal protein S3AE
MAQAKKRKRFFDVSIPIINKETQLYGYDIEDLNGRIIVYDLTRLLRGKSILLKLKVTVEDGKAAANPYELKIMPYFIRRMIRKGTNYVEGSFSAECKNAVLRIKPFLITRKKVSRAVRKALRDKARDELTNYVKEKTAEILFDDIIKNKIQKPLGLSLKKIYPLSLCEIRILKIEKFEGEEEKAQKKQA